MIVQHDRHRDSFLTAFDLSTGRQVRRARRFELVSANTLGEICMATPAPIGDLLIVRTRSHVVALGRTPS